MFTNMTTINVFITYTDMMDMVIISGESDLAGGKRDSETH